MSIFYQLPVYAYNVLRMASFGAADKENPPPAAVHKVRSRIPIGASGAAVPQWPSELKLFTERHPLGEIQNTAARHDLATTRPAKRETVLTKLTTPKGTVYKLMRSHTSTRTLANAGSKESYYKCKDRYLRDISLAFAEQTKNVTMRKREESPLDEQLKLLNGDWDLRAVRDGRWREVKPRVFTPRQRRSKSADRPKEFTEFKAAEIKPLTPKQIPVGLHNRVKNIKRSLKRPSSRELQTRTACEDIQSTGSLIQLDQELRTAVKAQLESSRKPAIAPEVYARELTAAYEYQIIQYLLKCGEEVRSPPRISAANRSIVVNWLVKVNNIQGPESGSPSVLQTAVRHLDRIFALDIVPLERVQLMAAACFWLAQKQAAKPRSATSFARHAKDAFCPSDLKAAEKYVLRRLNFPTIPVVPDDFVPYLVALCQPKQPELFTAAVTCLCTAALLDPELSSRTPDLLALAAVLNCLRLLEDGKRDALCESPVYQRQSKNSLLRLREVREEMVRTLLVMRDEKCPCREPYVLYARPPMVVSQMLVDLVYGHKHRREKTTILG